MTDPAAPAGGVRLRSGMSFLGAGGGTAGGSAWRRALEDRVLNSVPADGSYWYPHTEVLPMHDAQVKELLLQALEHERGGVKLYAAALPCARNGELKEEWEKYLAESRQHVQALEQVFQDLDLDPEETSPGRAIVAALGKSLLGAVETARREADPAAAQIIAAECVVLAETKDHFDWELIGLCAKKATGATGKALRGAYEQVEDQEDEHLYHTKGWCRELWIASLGMKAVLPPPEERKNVKTAIGAERAKNARTATPAR